MSTNLEIVAQLDSRIAVMERDLSWMKEQRNGLAAPFLRLPDDVTSKIFTLLQLQLIEVEMLTRWSDIMLVCRYLRRFAIQCPPLWSTFQVTSQDQLNRVKAHKWIDLCAERGKEHAVMLSISANSLTESLYPVMSTLMARTRDLRLQASGPAGRGARQVLGQDFVTLLTREWSALETLDISGVFNVPACGELLNGMCSTLTSLHLHNGSWNFEEFRLPTLPQLKQLLIDDFESEHLASNLVDGLTRIPNLRVLEVHFRTDSYATPIRPAATTTPLLLPHIQSLILEGSDDKLAYLLDKIPLPRSKLDIRLHQGDQGLRSLVNLSAINKQVLAFMQVFSTGAHPRSWCHMLIKPKHTVWQQLHGVEVKTHVDRYDSLRNLSYLGWHTTTEFDEFVRHTRKVDFTPQADIKMCLDIIQIAQPGLEALGFIQWESWWKPRAPRATVDVIETYLVSRKQSGNPLRRLEVDARGDGADTGAPEDVWQRQGLIEEVEVCKKTWAWETSYTGTAPLRFRISRSS